MCSVEEPVFFVPCPWMKTLAFSRRWVIDRESTFSLSQSQWLRYFLGAIFGVGNDSLTAASFCVITWEDSYDGQAQIGKISILNKYPRWNEWLKRESLHGYCGGIRSNMGRTRTNPLICPLSLSLSISSLTEPAKVGDPDQRNRGKDTQ